MKVSVHQPNYLPWVGYFRKMLLSDVFVFYDNIQYEKGGYTNRVKIKINKDPYWLTQPLKKVGILNKTIREIEFSDETQWKKKHLMTLTLNYKKLPYFYQIEELLNKIYENPTSCMSEFNIFAVESIANLLNIKTKFFKSSDIQYDVNAGPSEKLIAICHKLGGDVYLSGSGGQNYNDHKKFTENNIILSYDDWKAPVYTQKFDFLAGLSIVDILANMGVSETCAILKKGL